MTTLGPIGVKNNSYKNNYILNSKFIDQNIDLLVWDFDNTLIDMNAYNRHSMDHNYIRNELTFEQLTQDIPYWQFFKETVVKLVNNGKKVGIASFGIYKIIRAYMDKIFGFNQKYFTVVNIYARSSPYDKPLPNKNEYILNMMDHYRIKNPERVVLFDDLMTNISEASLIGIIAIHIPGILDNDDITNLFSPKTLVNFDDKIYNNSLINNNPASISRFGHVGDRKVAIDMYGRIDKSPFVTGTFFHPNGELINSKNRTEPPNNYNIIQNEINKNEKNNDDFLNLLNYSEPQIRQTKNQNQKIYENFENNETDYNLIIYIFSFILVIIIALVYKYIF